MSTQPPIEQSTQELIESFRRRAARRRNARLVAVVVVASLLVVGLLAVAATALRPSSYADGLSLVAEQADEADVPAAATGQGRPAIILPTISDPATPTAGEPTDQDPPLDYAAQTAPNRVAFEEERAMEHIRRLAGDIGVRASGTAGEAAAIAYAVEYLTGLGYEPRTPVVALPAGTTSRNVVAAKLGSSPDTLIIGAHLDSRAPAPGANDNASGAATVLELARVLRDVPTQATLTFVLFGAEETVDADEDHHHYGSRDYVRTMTAEQRAELLGMISVDMVAFGESFVVRSMGKGPRTLADLISRYAASQGGVVPSYLTDPGPSGWSDHEAFELAGYPVAWVEWRTDPAYHSVRDLPDHCRPELIAEAGLLLQGFLSDLRAEDLESLRGVHPR